MRNDKLEITLVRLSELFHQEYDRGNRDALKRIVDSMKGASSWASGRPAKAGGKRRAARGSAKAFIERVLKEKNTASVPTIMAAAQSPAERRVSIAAVRFELSRGKKDRTYRNSKGQWSLNARTKAA